MRAPLDWTLLAIVALVSRGRGDSMNPLSILESAFNEARSSGFEAETSLQPVEIEEALSVLKSNGILDYCDGRTGDLLNVYLTGFGIAVWNELSGIGVDGARFPVKNLPLVFNPFSQRHKAMLAKVHDARLTRFRVIMQP